MSPENRDDGKKIVRIDGADGAVHYVDFSSSAPSQANQTELAQTIVNNRLSPSETANLRKTFSDSKTTE